MIASHLSSSWTKSQKIFFLMLCFFGFASFMWIINMPMSPLGIKHDVRDRSRPVTKTTTKKVFKGDNKMTSQVFQECFDSPLMLCAKFSQVMKEATNSSPSYKVDPVSVTNRHKNLPVLGITTAVPRGEDYEAFRKFDYKVCSYPCKLLPRDRIKDAKAVYIDGDAVRDDNLPESRYDGQIYILSTQETLFHISGNLVSGKSKFKDQINLVTSYRLDSNVTRLYNQLCINDRRKGTRDELKKIYDRKTRTAVWIVSHCDSQSKRMKYVRELQKYIDVDIYGKCGNDSLKRVDSANDLMNKTYKFYLSFENSFCKDYVTEKIFKTFGPDLYIVPVVRGGANYKKYFPPNTFINAADFGSPSELATYLKDVSGNFESYLKYLEEKMKYSELPWLYKHRKWMCSVCAALHQSGNAKASRFKDVGEFLTKDICHSPDMSWRK